MTKIKFGGCDIELGHLLFSVAQASLGKDVADSGYGDEVDCAVSVNKIASMALGQQIGGGASTYLMYRALRNKKRFTPIKRLERAKPGDIIISPTGYGKNPKMPNGHVGIIGNNKKIMSNNSSNGKWSEKYNYNSWYKRYMVVGKYPVKVFRVK